MAQNLFDNAKFGDMFFTAENKQAVFLRFAENAEHKFAILYIEGWGNVQVFRHNGKEVHDDVAHSVVEKKEESVSKDLEESATEYVVKEAAKDINGNWTTDDILNAFKAGAQWQKEQFEKERLKHCDELTDEQAQMESDFVAKHLKENNRTPTFIDAIEYGKDLQKQQMMEGAVEAKVSTSLAKELGVEAGSKVIILMKD